MVYKLIQYILRVYLPVFFKRLEFRGLSNVPKDKPVIFAVNHQNAFLDGILVALKLNRPIYFLTRSDVFKGKLTVKVLNALNLIPIFRQQDRTGDIKENNRKTFQYCIDKLENSGAVLIFPEGVSEPIHHCFNLKKGVARLAFEAEEQNDFKLKLHVVPVAINYENHFIAGKKVFVSFLRPILMSEYRNVFNDSKSRAQSVFLKRLQGELRANLIHISGDYTRFKRRYWKGIVLQSRNDMEMIAAVKSIPQEKGLNTDGYNWKRDKYKYNRPRSSFAKIFSFLISLPGFIIFSPTILITKLLVLKVKDAAFYLSVVCLSWLLVGLIQLTIITFYLWSISELEFFIASMLVVQLLGYLSIKNFYKIF